MCWRKVTELKGASRRRHITKQSFTSATVLEDRPFAPRRCHFPSRLEHHMKFFGDTHRIQNARADEAFHRRDQGHCPLNCLEWASATRMKGDGLKQTYVLTRIDRPTSYDKR
jgi:hypothetical protein